MQFTIKETKAAVRDFLQQAVEKNLLINLG